MSTESPVPAPDSDSEVVRVDGLPEHPAAAEPPTANESRSRLPRPPFLDHEKKPLWPVVVLGMVVIGGLVGWRLLTQMQTSAPDTAPTETVSNQLAVKVQRIEPSTAQGWVFDEGTSLPVELRILNFQASGDITYVASTDGIPLREGDPVVRGQLLAQIDDRRQQASITTATADIVVAENQRDQSVASLAKARTGLNQAASDLALAQTELQRYQELYTQGAVPESERDIYINRVDQAEAAYANAEQDVRSAEDGLRSAGASVTAAEARRSQTTVDLEDTQLVSPINGVVAYINIQQGGYWNSQYLRTTTPQDVIETAPIVVVDPSTYEVELEVQGSQAQRIQPGQRAYVVLEEDISFDQAAGASQADLLALARQEGSAGQVFAVSPSQTPGSRGTEISIRDFRQVRNLRIGGRVYVWIETEQNQNAIVIPPGSLLARDQEFFVFVVDEADNTVQRRRVTTGIEGLTGLEILSGVEAGDLLVVEGQNRLVDGAPVEIIDEVTP